MEHNGMVNENSSETVKVEAIPAIQNNAFNSTIAAFEELKKVAEYLANSETFSKDFQSKDKDGNIIRDETGKPVVNSADIAFCLMAGREMGFDMTGSLMLGKKLNPQTYLSVLKGRGMGIDAATSMEKIVSIPTKNGLVSYTMVDIISAKLIQGGIKFLPFIKNYAPFYTYINAFTKEELDLDIILDDNDDLKPEYFALTSTTKVEDIKRLQEENKIIVTKIRHGFYTKIIFNRTMSDGSKLKHVQRFSTVDAERSGYLPLYDDKGAIIQSGKPVWINATPQMMGNRCLSIGGRIIGADLINGIYTKEEAQDLIDTVAEVL